MIRKLLNMTCTEGHRYFAPDPQAWDGKTCNKTNPDAPKSHGCQGTLHPDRA